MSFRITTNGMLRNYKTNLYNNTKKVNDSMERVQTGRLFNSYAEDPVTASKAFQLRRSFWRTGDQIDNSEYIISKFQTGWDALDEIVDGTSEHPGLNGIDTALKALNDPEGGARKILGQEMMTEAESVAMLMNTRYGDEFVFAGADGLNAPFSWSEDGALLYRGIDVSTEKPKTQSDFLAGDGTEDTEAYEAYKAEYKERNGYDVETGAAKYAKLEAMTKEATYADIGIGIKAYEDGSVIPSTAYNTALSGINTLGYGVDEDGDPKNIVMLMKQLGQVFNDCDQDSGEFGRYDEDGNWVKDPSMRETAERLSHKLRAAINHVSEQHVALDAQVKYLKKNETQLESKQDTLAEQIDDVERGGETGMAESIMEMSWARYCYEAALRIGNSILSQSLLDYMR